MTQPAGRRPTSRTIAALVCALALSPAGARAGDGEPATKAARKVMETIALVESKLTATRYQHKTVVSLKKGLFYWDCSGMAAWILRRAAPKAMASLPHEHPLAKQFHGVIAASPVDGPKKGWMRLDGPEDIRPGDVFAWLKPTFWKKRKNTGHVGFVVGEPRPHPVHGGVWLMRIADASRYTHEDDTRPDDGTGGYGTGTIAFLFDGNGQALAYGWYGSLQEIETYVPTHIVFARVFK